MKLNSNPNAFMRKVSDSQPQQMFATSPHLPANYIATVERAIENYGVESVESDSSSTCTDDTESDNAMELSNALRYEDDDFFIYDEIIATDKTSVSSSDWGDVACEYDLQESDRVRLMFSAMFGMLFSEVAHPVPPAHLAKEGSEWMVCFPHLRLLGSQLMPPQEQGFSLHKALEAPAGCEPARREVSGNKGISLMGLKLEPNSPPLSGREAAASELEDCVESEEILESEGIFEETIAVDYRLGEDEVAEVRRHRRRGLPPMTPSAAIRDSVLNSVFDTLWSSWLPTIRPLLTRILRGPQDADLELCQLPQIDEADLIGLATEPRNASSLSRLPKVMGAESDVLSSLLHISIKTLQFRERSNLQDIPEGPNTDRRRSTDRNAFPPSAFRAPGAGEAPRVTSAARRGRAHHLAPISRSRSFQVEDDAGLGLRGKRLQGPLGVPVEPLSRSGTLPPLPTALLKAPPVGAAQRVSSAAGAGPQPGASRPPPPTAGGLPGHTAEMRPSTTHTFHAPPGKGGSQNLLISGYSFGTAHTAATLSEENEEKAARAPWGPVYNSSLFPVHQVRKKSNALNNSSIVR